jgi:hypothetical protein
VGSGGGGGGGSDGDGAADLVGHSSGFFMMGAPEVRAHPVVPTRGETDRSMSVMGKLARAEGAPFTLHAIPVVSTDRVT